MKNKKIVQINTVCNGSTGRIMHDIQAAAKNAGYNTFSFYGRRTGFKDLPCEKIGNPVSFWFHVIITTAFDAQGKGSYFCTKYLIKRLKEENPDIIHLHNMHGYYLNIKLLFHYLNNEFEGKIIWTFHDCWPITGHCPYFVIAECTRWMKECHTCPNKKKYPITLGLDLSKINYRQKKKLFSGLKNLTIVCPSVWIKDIVQHSFIKDAKCIVVPNGINLELFFPRRNELTEKKYKIPIEKKLILGVASIWEPRKGLDDFLKLSTVLSEEYVIALVGLNKSQMRKLPSNIIGISRTENQNELAELYTRADIFMNPSKEESFSLVTVEAMACGTPVIALDTSAVKELVNVKNGILIHNNEIKDYLGAIEDCMSRNYQISDIRKSVEKYSVRYMTDNILEIYSYI